MPQSDSVALPSFGYWRERRGLTHSQLALRIGMTLNTVRRVEAGYPVRARTARLLATALHVQVDVLMDQPPEV